VNHAATAQVSMPAVTPRFSLDLFLIIFIFVYICLYVINYLYVYFG